MIVQWSSGELNANMAEELLIEVRQLVLQHPWWQARARLAIRLLREFGVAPPACVLDAGCGWGVTLAALERAMYQVTGLDVSRRVLSDLDTPSRQLIEADLSQPISPEFHSKYDAVLALDVIEHTDDDRKVVAALGQLVRSGGTVIVSVPAMPDLFSDFDRVQGHRRRYTTATLTQAFSETGLMLLHTFWWGAWMVPLLRLQRLRFWKHLELSPLQTYRQFLTLPPWPAPLAMKIAYRLDEPLALRGVFRSGTSLFAIARRRH